MKRRGGAPRVMDVSEGGGGIQIDFLRDLLLRAFEVAVAKRAADREDAVHPPPHDHAPICARQHSTDPPTLCSMRSRSLWRDGRWSSVSASARPARQRMARESPALATTRREPLIVATTAQQPEFEVVVERKWESVLRNASSSARAGLITNSAWVAISFISRCDTKSTASVPPSAGLLAGGGGGGVISQRGN